MAKTAETEKMAEMEKMLKMEGILTILRKTVDINSLDNCKYGVDIVNWVKKQNQGFKSFASEVNDITETIKENQDFKSFAGKVEMMNNLSKTLMGFTRSDVAKDEVKLSKHFAKLKNELNVLCDKEDGAAKVLKVISSASSLLIENEGDDGTDEGLFKNKIIRATTRITGDRKALFAENLKHVGTAAYNIQQTLASVVYGVWDYDKHHKSWFNKPEYKSVMESDYDGKDDEEKKIDAWKKLALLIEPTLEHLKKDERTVNFHKVLIKIYDDLNNKLK